MGGRQFLHRHNGSQSIRCVAGSRPPLPEGMVHDVYIRIYYIPGTSASGDTSMTATCGATLVGEAGEAGGVYHRYPTYSGHL